MDLVVARGYQEAFERTVVSVRVQSCIKVRAKEDRFQFGVQRIPADSRMVNLY